MLYGFYSFLFILFPFFILYCIILLILICILMVTVAVYFQIIDAYVFNTFQHITSLDWQKLYVYKVIPYFLIFYIIYIINKGSEDPFLVDLWKFQKCQNEYRNPSVNLK